MGPEGSLSFSQEPATGSYPKLDESNPHPKPDLNKIHFNIILPPTPTAIFKITCCICLPQSNFTMQTLL
jgi:hypothetical protein